MNKLPPWPTYLDISQKRTTVSTEGDWIIIVEPRFHIQCAKENPADEALHIEDLKKRVANCTITIKDGVVSVEYRNAE